MRSLKIKGLWSALICTLFVIAALHEVSDLGMWQKRRVLTWDAESYYHYLPAVLIHHNVRDLSYVASVDSTLHPALDQRNFGIYHALTTGYPVIKFSYGVALFECPLFLLAHAYCLLSDGAYPADGYSAPYHLAVSLSTVLFVALGLFILRKVLLRHVEDNAAAIALAIVAFGTNLFYYSAVEGGMSHGYLFFLYALIVERTDSWHRDPQRAALSAIAFAVGLVSITRPVEAAVVLVPLFWGTWPGEAWRAKWQLVRQHRDQLPLALLFGLLPFLPQFIYWQYTTGFFLYYSYGGERFNWTDPHIIDGLFGFRKGWFIYSPLVVLGFVGLVLMLRDKSLRTLAAPLVLYFPVICYLVFCWYQWWYGGSFGCRPLVGSLALLALPMSVLIARVMRRTIIIRALFMLLVLAGIRLNMFQQHQYLETIIRWDGMTKERYFEVFGHDNWDGLAPFEP